MSSLHINIQGWKANDCQTTYQTHHSSSHSLSPAALVTRPHSKSSPLPMASRSASLQSLGDQDEKNHYTSSYTSASSERRAIRNRERDPSWVPRPSNAFIIFRSEYSRIHAQTHKGDGSPPPPEKTLSKRAAEAWSKLTEDEKAPYKVRADQERVEHARRHPDYRYRPRRRHSTAGRATGGISRREQVESFVRRTAERGHLDSESDYSAECSSPATSMTSSSSPEPYDDPYRGTSPAKVRSHDPRSQSLPRQQNLGLPSRPGLSYFHSSTPSLVSRSDHSLYRLPRLVTDHLDDAYPTPPGSQHASSGSDDGHSSVHSFLDSPLSANLEGELHHSLSFHERSLLSDTPEEPYGFAPGSSFPDTLSSGPRLYHRRQRAATTSALPPSPLSVITSSLGHCSSEPSPVFDARASTSPHRTLADASLLLASSVQGEVMSWRDGHGVDVTMDAGTLIDNSSLPAASGSGDFLVPPGVEIDFDRTPRYSTFPQDVQNPYTAPSDASPVYTDSQVYVAETTYTRTDPAMYSSDAAVDYESYTIGLGEMGIGPTFQDLSPFEELAFNEFFVVDPET